MIKMYGKQAKGFELLAALLVLAVLASAQAQVEPLLVELRNLSADVGGVYDWTVTSTLLTSSNITLSVNLSSTATFQLDVLRKPAGNAHTISGTIIATNPQDNLLQITIEGFRLAMSTGALFGSSTKTLSCPSATLGPGEMQMCDFRVPASSNIKSVTPSAAIQGAATEVGDSSPVTFSEDSIEATADDSSSKLACALIKDSVSAAGAQEGFKVAPTTNSEGNQLLDGGVQVCQDAARFTYTMKVGPFSDACGEYKFQDAPDVEPQGGGSVSVAPAAGVLTITGCRQKDILGLLKPSASLSQLTVGKATSYTWTANTGASIATASAASPASAAAPVAGLEAAAGEAMLAGGAGWGSAGQAAAGGLLSSTVAYTSSLAVQSAVNVSRSSSATASNSLNGEVTITNTQRMPYILAGGRVAITRAPSNLTSSSSNSRTAQAAAVPNEIFGNLSCPLGASGTIIVPPQIMGSMPGTLRCTFSLPVSSNFTAGFVQAQLKTLLSSSYEVDSGAPVAFSFSSNATAMDIGGCVSIWAQRITNANTVSAADREANPDLDALLREVEQQGLRLAGTPQSVKGWVPPPPNSLLSIPVTVCGNKTLEWTDINGPFEAPRDCGRSLAVMAITIKPKTGSQQPIHTALSYPLTVTGCGLVPSVAVESLKLSAKKTYSWSLDKVATPTTGLNMNFNQQDFIKYDVSYNRSSHVSGQKLQALVRIVNPHSTPITVAKVSYTVSRPSGQQPLTGTAICRTDLASAAKAALEAKDSSGQQQLHVLQPSPAAVAAAQATAQAAAADSSNNGVANLFGALFSAGRTSRKSGDRALLGAAAAKAEEDAEQPEQQPEQQLEEQQPAPLDANGPPLFCAFVLQLPDDFAGQMTVNAITDLGEQGAAISSALDWSTVQLEEVGKCALLSATFQQTQPASLLQPASVVGTMPPAVKVCEPTKYSFKALFGPFNESQCGGQQAILNVAVNMLDSAAMRKDNSISALNITGCPETLPLVTLQPPVPTEVTSSYNWTIERSLQPLEPAAAAVSVSGAGYRMAAPAGVTVETPDGMALFRQTIVFRRSEPVMHGSGGRGRLYQLRGTVSLVNPTDKPLQLSEVAVKVAQQGPSAAEPVVTVVTAACPKEVVKVAADPKKGKVIELPAGGESKPVVCSFGTLLNQGGLAEVLAVAVMAADGRRAKSEKAFRVDFSEVKPVTAGTCVKVSESQQLVDTSTGQALPTPSFIGSKVPVAPEMICGTKSYQMLGQIGPLAAVADAAGAMTAAGARLAGSAKAAAAAQQGCGALSLISAVVADPTNGYQGKVLSNGRFDVRFEGCKQAA